MTVPFTNRDIDDSIMFSLDEQGYEFHCINSMYNYVNYFSTAVSDNSIAPKSPKNKDKLIRYLSSEDEGWVFGPDYDQETYYHRLNNWEPYQHVIDEINRKKGEFLADKRIKELFKRLTLLKRSRKFTVDDGELVFERVMAGDPEYYQKSIRKEIKKGIRILLDFSQSCMEDVNAFIENCIEMFKIAYIFEFMGIPVEILSGGVSLDATDNKRLTGVLFVLKEKSEKINLQKAALLACPGLLRHTSFIADAILLSGKISSGHGYVSKMDDKAKRLLNVDFVIGARNDSKKVIEELTVLSERL